MFHVSSVYTPTSTSVFVGTFMSLIKGTGLETNICSIRMMTDYSEVATNSVVDQLNH